jgi:arylsulfatase A-like enzyme
MVGRVTRRDFLGAAAGTAAAITGVAARRSWAAGQPNVLFILADDLGYGDLSCYGRPDYETPVLDGLATQGMKLTSAYSAGAVCTPTRCAFVTGRYQQRLDVGLQEPLVLGSPPVGIPRGHPTIATQLRAAGYDTALVGKWHLGWRPEFNPTEHGFDEFFGVLSGAVDYFTHVASDAGGAEGGAPPPDLWENTTRVARTGYLTDLLTERAVEIVSRTRSKPFYLSLHYTAPHAPWEGPADAGLDHGAHGTGPMTAGGSLRTFAAMMRSMDEGIGRVLDALRRARLERDTLVIFTSDNGGERYSYNWPFSFQKGYVNEGGIRVPAIVRWPGVVHAGRTTQQAVITMDWTATILAAAGASASPSHPLDGDDLRPVLSGERDMYDRSLFWRTRTGEAARLGNWKYVKQGNDARLYDLSVDPGEKTDLKDAQPGVFAHTWGAYEDWARQMLPRPASA